MPSFRKNVGSMVLGTAGSQLISLLAAPLIARLFLPEDFGVAALFISITAIMAIPTTLRLEHAIVLPKEDAKSLMIISVAVHSVIGFCFAGLFMVSAFYFLGVSLITESSLGAAVYLLPVAVFLIGASNIATGYATRIKSFKTIASGNLSQSISVVCLRVITGFVSGSSAMALVVTLIIGSAIKLMAIVRGVDRPLKKFVRFPRYYRLKNVLSDYRQFPLYSIPTGLLRTFNDNLPILVLANLFAPQIVGLYAMASRLIKAPMMVLSEPIRLAYLQKSSELVQQGKSVERSLLLITLAMLLLAMLFILPLTFFGRELFQLVLGQEWVDAGTYAAIVSPWFASVLVQSPSSCIYIVYKKQKYLVLLQGAATVVMVLCALVAHALQLSVIAALTAFSAVGTMLNLLQMIIAFFMVRKPKYYNSKSNV